MRPVNNCDHYDYRRQARAQCSGYQESEKDCGHRHLDVHKSHDDQIEPTANEPGKQTDATPYDSGTDHPDNRHD
jgi:hypothetical protein